MSKEVQCMFFCRQKNCCINIKYLFGYTKDNSKKGVFNTMKDLKCALKECKFNKGFSCVAEQISVDGSAHCISYEVSQEKLSDKMFEIGSDSCKPNYSVDTHIGCTANECLFNKSEKCHANGITVLGDSDFDTKQKCADCATFTKK